jgi:hypothetical protein
MIESELCACITELTRFLKLQNKEKEHREKEEDQA